MMINQGNKQTTHQINDVPIYSPSSSTSLLYHVYDQINANYDNNANFRRSNTTTILNPAKLFNSTGSTSNNSNSNRSNNNNQITLAPQQVNQQHFLTGNKTNIAQQDFYSSGGQFHHLHQPFFSNTLHHQQHHHLQHQQQQPSNPTYGLDSHQLMLDTYGRQPRQTSGQLPPLPPINASKSQNTLASVLRGSQTLSGHVTPTTIDNRGPKKLSHHQFPTSSGVGGFARARHNVRKFAYEYSTALKCLMLCILLTFSLMPILKFTSFNDSQPTAASQNQPSNQIPISDPFVYPPTRIKESIRPVNGDQQTNKWSIPAELQPAQSASSQGPATQNSPDLLSSKLLFGEFVISSQTYSASPAQKSLLAENIVKLMDQVFLSTDVRRVYSRMQITNIRPHFPSGIVVDCNIILSESIIYAAQQFGIALYESLAKSNEKLANQPGYIIDKNSIRFNTVSDKDLPIVPPQLLPAAFARPEITPMAPSEGQLNRQPSNDEQIPSTTGASSLNGADVLHSGAEQSAVVWTEWSQWSSCVDKNGMCDPTRLHSRLRKCVSQNTGEKVEAIECKQRFNMQDLELEVNDCSATCTGSLLQQQQQQHPQQHQGVQSDAPLLIVPQVAPGMFSGIPLNSELSVPFQLASSLNRGVSSKQGSGQQQAAQKLGAFDAMVSQSGADLTSPSSPPSSQTSSVTNGQDFASATQTSAPIVPMVQLDNSSQQQQMSCSNCTNDEICLLLISQKVPFCAKIKDRQDESGCGGWCKADDLLCQPAGLNSFKCTHNSECLPGEWRCNDSLCIPLSKRCDGHENCYDSSDERFCPTK